MATKQELLDKAQQIKNETLTGANTAVRVGQMLEDIINQYDMGYINYYSLDLVTMTDIVINEWRKIESITTLGLRRDGLEHSNNRITNTGEHKVVEIISNTSLSSDNNNVLDVAIFKNGIILPDSIASLTMPTSSRKLSISNTTYVELDTDDYIEIFLRNTTSISDVDVYNINVKCLQIGL